jgi:hypothetical protein
MANKYCLLYKGTWTEITEDDYFTYKESGSQVYIEKNGPCGTSKGSKPKVDQNPVPDNKKKKTTPVPVPKKVCTDKNGNTISNSGFEPEFKTVEGLKQFKNYLIKYYPSYVIAEGGVDQLNSATINDCMLMRLFYTGDPDKSYYAIGRLIYPDWKKEVGGYMNSDSKTKDEFDKWKKGGETSDEEENTNFSEADWQVLIDNGQVSNKAIIRNFQGIYVLYYKYDENGEMVSFDDLTTDNKLAINTMIKNIVADKNTYIFWKPPVKNSDPETNTKFPLLSKRYKFIVEYDANNNPSLSPEEMKKFGPIRAPKTKIDESLFKNFILEKIREKNGLLGNLYEVTTITSTKKQTIDFEGNDLETNPKDGSQKTVDDVFGLNSIVDVTARKIQYEEFTPILQNYLNEESRSDYFAEWNKVGKELKSSMTLKIPELSDIKVEFHNKEITNSNEILVSETTDINQYTQRYFYELLKIKGDPAVNTATIYLPIRSTTPQKTVVGKCDIKKCRTDLIDYLRLGFTKSYTPKNTQELEDRWRNLCNCNASGCFEAFKRRGKLAGTGFEEKGYSRDKINVDPSDSEKNELILIKDVLPKYKFQNNRNLSWKEITELIRGDQYPIAGGEAQIDSDLRIPNFGLPGSWCDLNLSLKESFDERIDNKLLESIKDKNKKESIIENVLKNLLKDK